MKKIYPLIFSSMACVAANAAPVDMSEPKTIIADKIEYDIKSESIQTSGQTEIINQSGQRMTLRDSYISKDGDALAGDDIKIWLGRHVYLDAESITRDGDFTVAHDATFTACDGCDPYGDA